MRERESECVRVVFRARLAGMLTRCVMYSTSQHPSVLLQDERECSIPRPAGARPPALDVIDVRVHIVVVVSITIFGLMVLASPVGGGSELPWGVFLDRVQC